MHFCSLTVNGYGLWLLQPLQLSVCNFWMFLHAILPYSILYKFVTRSIIPFQKHMLFAAKALPIQSITTHNVALVWFHVFLLYCFFKSMHISYIVIGTIQICTTVSWIPYHCPNLYSQPQGRLKKISLSYSKASQKASLSLHWLKTNTPSAFFLLNQPQNSARTLGSLQHALQTP